MLSITSLRSCVTTTSKETSCQLSCIVSVRTQPMLTSESSEGSNLRFHPLTRTSMLPLSTTCLHMMKEKERVKMDEISGVTQTCMTSTLKLPRKGYTIPLQSPGPRVYRYCRNLLNAPCDPCLSCFQASRRWWVYQAGSCKVNYSFSATVLCTSFATIRLS